MIVTSKFQALRLWAVTENVPRLLYDSDAYSDLYSFKIAGYDDTFGYLLKYIVDASTWPTGWSVSHEEKVVLLSGSTREERNEVVNSMLLAEKKKNTFASLRKWAGEVFPIYGPKKELVLSMEGAATPLFGVVRYGVQLLAYQKADAGISVWIARRAKSKKTFPGMLDSTVGGSLPTGESPFECLVREAEEEASFSPSLIRDLAKPCGTLSYINITDQRTGGELGLICPEVQYLYEMQLPENIKPRPGEDDVEEITLLNVEQLKYELATGQFTPTHGCVLLDFFIRHGILTAENEPDYIEITSRLHRKHIFPTT